MIEKLPLSTLNVVKKSSINASDTDWSTASKMKLDALAKPTYLAALSVHVSPARQGIVIGTAQALIAIADFISPVLGGFVLGYALYGVWIGIAISVAIIGLVTAMIYLSKSSVLIVKPETE